MATTVTSQIQGITINEAIKAPCATVATTNITLAGYQTISGVTITAASRNKRVLVKGQTNPIENGIYDMDSSSWQRSKDADGNRDLVQGTRVLVHSSTIDGVEYELTTANPIVIGTTALTFQLRYGANAIYDQTEAEIAAGVVPTDREFPAGDIRRYGAVDGQDSTTAIANAFAQMNAGGADVYIPTGTFTSTTSHAATYTGWRIIGDDCVRSIIRFTGSGVGIVIGGTAGGGLFGYMRGIGLYNAGTRSSGLVLYNAGGSSFYNVFVGGLGVGFSSHGVLINENYDSPKGNNNNMRFFNCNSQRNTGAGFAFSAPGSDHNAVEFIACNGSNNTSHGLLLKGQANRVIGGIFEGNGGYGIQISEAADTPVSSTRSVIMYPYLESNTSGGVRGGSLSLANVIYLDGLNANSSYTRAAGSEDFWIQATNSSGPILAMGDPACYLKVQSVTSGTPRLGLSPDGSTTNLTFYVNGKGTGGTWLEADNDTTTALVKIGQQGSGLRNVLRGQTNFGANTTANVSFGVTLPSTAYTIQIGANANKTFWWSSKTTTGFTLNASAVSSDTVDWTVVL